MDQIKEKKLNTAPKHSNSREKLPPLVVNLSAKDQSTDGLSQASPAISTDIPSPRSEEEILEALKESSILAPKREVQQERWNKELFLKIAGVARVISKTKSMRTYKLASAAPSATVVESEVTRAVTKPDAIKGIDNISSEAAKKHTQDSAYTASSAESPCNNSVEMQVDESSTVSGTPPETPTSEVCSTLVNQEDAATANESTEPEATKTHTEELSYVASSEVQQDIIVEGVTPSVTRTGNETNESKVTEKLEEQDASVAEETSPNEANKRHSSEQLYVAINGAAMQTTAAEKGVDATWYKRIFPLRAPSSNISTMQTRTPKKIILTCKMNISASETEKRKVRRKWNYIKVVISDLQEALRHKPTSIETAKIIEDSLEELQQVVQDIEASIEEVVPVLKKLGAEIKNQSSMDKHILKREISSKLSTELASLTDSYAQYEETAKRYKKSLDMQENILERVVNRRESHDTKIADQQNKIAKIKNELVTAEEELENMEKRRNDLLEEEEECKEETKSAILELKSTEENLSATKEKVSQINDHLDHLNETIDQEFELRKKEMLDLVEQLLELEIS